jgi:hypothetical protein
MVLYWNNEVRKANNVSGCVRPVGLTSGRFQLMPFNLAARFES